MAFSFGSIDAKGLEHLCWHSARFGGIGVGLALGTEFDVLLSGEEEAASLGLDLRRSRRWLIWATLPVAGTVAIGGGIAFVGLVVPHLIRGWVCPLHRGLLACAALGGAIFVLACDILAALCRLRGKSHWGDQ